MYSSRAKPQTQPKPPVVGNPKGKRTENKRTSASPKETRTKPTLPSVSKLQSARQQPQQKRGQQISDDITEAARMQLRVSLASIHLIAGRFVMAFHFETHPEMDTAMKEFLDLFSELKTFIYDYYLKLSSRAIRFKHTEQNDLFRKIRSEIWGCMVISYPYIHERIYSRSHDKHVRVADEVFLLLANLNMCIVEPVRNISPADIPYVLSNYLTKTRTGIFEMNVLELVDSVKQLSYRWDKLHYDPALFEYMELLELRASTILMQTQSYQIHNVDEFRVPTNDPDMFSYSRDLLNLFVGYFVNFKIRLSNLGVAPSIPCPEEYLPEPWKQSKILQWLKKVASKTFGDGIYVKYRIKYLPRIESPGDREEFLRKRPNDIPTEQKIFRFIHGDAEAQKLLEFSAEREASDIVADCEETYPRSAPTMIYIVLDSMFFGMFGIHISRYVIYSEELMARHLEFTRERDPILVQTFNHFDVYYQGQIFQVGGFIKSLVVLMNILERNHDRKLENGTVDISKMYSEFYGSNFENQAEANDAADALALSSGIATVAAKDQIEDEDEFFG